MVRNNRSDGKKSVYHDDLSGSTCRTCGGSGSDVDNRGRHIGTCRTCRGFGKTER